MYFSTVSQAPCKKFLRRIVFKSLLVSVLNGKKKKKGYKERKNQQANHRKKWKSKAELATLQSDKVKAG